MNINDLLAQRGDMLEELSGDELLDVAYQLLDEIEALRKHVGAMRGLILDLDTEIEQTSEAENVGRYDHNEKAIEKVLAAYDAYIKEA